MSIISKIARLFGYSLAKYSDPVSFSKKVAALHPNTHKTTAIISSSEASDALKSVGRSAKLNPFVYYPRPEKSSAAMERLENTWWNAHGRLIEKVWVFSDETNSDYRKAYVSRAAEFFRQSGGKTRILDLGCGSGWFGRMIVAPDLEYIGTDFSSTQIEIANQEKQRSPFKDQLSYYCVSDLKTIPNIQTISGVVIHAFLHHLYWNELHDLFSELASTLPENCKFFIVEPVYPEAGVDLVNTSMQKHTCELVKTFRSYLNSLKIKLADEGKYDTLMESNLLRIESESAQNGFFFSPKEVPFRLGELKVFLEKYLRIEKVFPCGILNLETAQFLEKITDKTTRNHYSGLLFPLVNPLDEFLLRNGYFESNPDNYLFTAFECSLRKGDNSSVRK